VAAMAAALLLSPGAAARASAPDSLSLQAPLDVRAWSVYSAQTSGFAVWLTWRDSPDSCGAFVHPCDTTGWRALAPTTEPMSLPEVKGPYKGDIDRTIVFRVPPGSGGFVGSNSIQIDYSVRREESILGSVILPATYVPNTWLPLTLTDRDANTPVDFGLQIRFGPGRIDANGGFIAGLEDFEGFHVWRGTERDGKDLQVIGELSKEEAFRGNAPGGSFVDSLYFFDILPTLRTAPSWLSPFGPVDCLGIRINTSLPDFDEDDNPIPDLAPDQLFWFDCTAVNGFTYYYGITTFDRGYTPSSSQQGLVKFDHCEVTQGATYPCADELVKVEIKVQPQSDLYKVYVVPNPVRTGGSRLTTDNYHNFPDGLVRFVNVPASCTIKIFTVAGDLVWIREHTDGAGNVEWDTRNLEEQDVASGVYVYRIEAGGDSVYGRIVVIR
jgi:hypothetical protein